MQHIYRIIESSYLFIHTLLIGHDVSHHFQVGHCRLPEIFRHHALVQGQEVVEERLLGLHQSPLKVFALTLFDTTF